MAWHDRRPRYPKKRFNPRLLLLLGLPALLIVLLVAAALVISGDDTPESAAAPAPPPFTRLDPARAYPKGPLPGQLRFDRLLMEKSARRLTAFAKGEAVRVYLVALGENPLGHKEVQGDKRTPQGFYSIDGKNPKSAYHKNIGISYPNEADRAHAKSLNKSPGGDIKIHGLAPEFAWVGEAHRATDWTHGCIAVTNEEMDEIYDRTPIGTPIEIVP